MYCNYSLIKDTLKTKNGMSTATVPTFKGDVTYTWYDQHDSHVYKDDNKLKGSGCAEIATLCAALTFSDVYGKVTPYDFRHKKQQKLLGHMRMPWHPTECVKVINSAGIRTEYYNRTSMSDCYNKIYSHLTNGMPVLAWV
jgi:hypothetical protein